MKGIIQSLIVLLLVSSCSIPDQKDFFEKHRFEEIQNVLIYGDVRAVNDFLAELKPLWIYRDRGHYCVVTKIDDEFEYGLYFVPATSSYLRGNDDEWEFKYHKNGKIEYKRVKEVIPSWKRIFPESYYKRQSSL